MSVDDGKTVYGLLVLGLKVWLFGLDMLRDWASRWALISEELYGITSSWLSVFATTLLEAILLDEKLEVLISIHTFLPYVSFASNDGCPLDRMLLEKVTDVRLLATPLFYILLWLFLVDGLLITSRC
jgi:hypothetical protein